MRTKAIVTAVWCLTASLIILGQERGGGPPQPVSTADVEAPAIPGVFASGTKARVVYQWDAGLGAEGPVSLPDGSAIFTQTSGKKIIKVDNKNVGSVFVDVQPAQVFGLAYDPKHGVVATYRGTPNGVVALWPERKVLADSLDGKRFDRPNDIVADGTGNIYFSDNSGIRGKEGPAPGSAPPGVYRIGADGKVLLAWEGKPDCPPSCTALQRPNGVQISPDRKVFYVATGGSARWVYAFEMQPDGRLRNPREFADLGEGGADGMVVDAEGRLYVAAATRLMVFDRTGKALGAVTFPQRIANLTFAGPVRKTLFIVGGQVAYKLPVLTEGVKGRQK